MRQNEWLELVIIGAGGHGSEVLSYVGDLARDGEKIRILGLVDDQKPRGRLGDAEILGGFGELEALLTGQARPVCGYITATGDNRARRECVRKVDDLKAGLLTPWTLRHPKAIIGEPVTIGAGTCLAPGSILTTNVRIGRHCIVNVGASVSHDAEIGDYVNINPGAVVAGKVRIGEGCYIGAGVTVIDKVSIGEWTTIGAGAVVIENLPPYVTAVGVPAKIIKRHAARPVGVD